MRTCWFLAVAFASFSALAQVSEAEKLQRVQLISELGQEVPQINVEAYQRDLQYDKQNLSIEERTQRELNMLTEKVKNAVVESYQEKIDNNQDPESAYNEVRESIETDLTLADPAFKDELQRIALSALDLARDGGGMSEASSSSLENVIAKNIEERGLYLNRDAGANASADVNNAASSNNSISSRAKDSERLVYNNKQELLNALVSNGDNTKWVSTGSANIDLGKSTSKEGSVTIQLKFKFLGTGIEGGPTITFNRTVGANAVMMHEGMDEPIDAQGRFNIWKKDFDGKLMMKNGQKQRRFMAFYCSVWTTYTSTYKGEATVSFDAGMGSVSASASLSNYETTSNAVNTRRMYIPDTIAGQIVTVNTIRQICWKDILNTQIRRGLTVKQSLFTMTKNLLSNMAFSHPKSKCAVDTQCMPWARRLNFSAAVKRNLYPRCIEESKEKFRYCKLKGLENTYCAVYDQGRMVSPEMLGGYTECDNGLKCTVTSPVLYVPGTTWIFRAAVGVCKPANPSAYRRPVLR